MMTSSLTRRVTIHLRTAGLFMTQQRTLSRRDALRLSATGLGTLVLLVLASASFLIRSRHRGSGDS